MKPTSILIPALLLLLPALANPPAARAFDGCRAADVDHSGGMIELADIFSVMNSFGSQDPRKDLDGSGLVDEPDLYIVLDFFGVGCPSSCPGDLDQDGDVDADDRALLETAIVDGLDCRFDLTRDGIVDGREDIDTCVYYFGNASPASSRCDFDDNGSIGTADILQQIDAIGTDCRPDLNKDGEVDTNDLWALLSSWGACP